jgi:hypothetical protein
LELVTVGLDTLGAAGCRRFIEAAEPSHPSLLDQHHVLARLFGVINIPSSIWIDESGTIVRPAETAPAPPKKAAPAKASSGSKRGASARQGIPRPEMPERFKAMRTEAQKIPNDAEAYHAALRDWAEKGARSRFALSPEEVVARSRPRSAEVARGHAHFEIASHLELNGHHEAAVRHFKEAHRLVPDSWTFRRQAWSLEVGSLEGGAEGPFARFWQGPSADDPESWPYDGDWLSDVRAVGPENYNERFRA